MSAQKLLPAVEELLRWREEGLSQAQMVERINASNRASMGDAYRPVTRSAVSVALVRAGATSPSAHAVAIPWTPILPEHNNQYPRTMLRLWSRRLSGEELSDPQNSRLAAFEASLRSANEVIDYSSDSGFIRVQARPGIDCGLIREPNR